MRRHRPSRQALAELVPALLTAAACGGEAIDLGGTPPEPQAPTGAGGAAPSPAAPLPLPSLEVSGLGPVTELNTDGKEDNVTLTGDQLELCFTSERSGGTGDVDVYCASRASLSDDFGPALEAAGVNSSGFETSAALSLDGLSIWVGSDREGGQGGLDVWRSDRIDRASPWLEPALEVSLNSAADDIPRPLGMGGTIMPLASRRDANTYWTYFASRRSDGSFAEPTLIEELSETDRLIVDAQLSEDGRVLLYARLTESRGQDIYYSVRSTIDEAFGAPIPLTGANSPGDERDPWLSPDGTALYFVSDRAGSFDIYRAVATLGG